MTAAFGVYLGCTTASFAVCKDDGKTDVIANDAGDRVTPAVVAFTDHDQTVGLAAKHGMIRNAANTIKHVKQTMGRNLEELQSFSDNNTVKLLKKNGKTVFEVEYKEKVTNFRPEDIAALIYKRLMDTATNHGDEGETHDTVLAVPIDYMEEQKEAFKRAATAAGFHVMRVINEPSAALLAYDIGQTDIKESCTVLVYKLGGTSLDLSVYSVVGGMYRLLGYVRDTNIGGHMIDSLMVDHFADEFCRQWKCDCRDSAKARGKLRNAAETCKHILSTMNTAQSYIESLYDGIDFLCKISRGRFEALCSSFFSQCVEPLNKVLEENCLQKEDIHKVILCGGTTKIPALQQRLKNYFVTAEILSSILPDEVIAVGAAKQASLLSGSEPEELSFNEAHYKLPCLTQEIFVEAVDCLVTVLPKFTPIPIRKQHKFLLNPEQSSFCMKVNIRQSEGDAIPLAQISMSGLPEGSQVVAVFHARSDGSLHITCSEPTSNASKDVTIEASS